MTSERQAVRRKREAPPRPPESGVSLALNLMWPQLRGDYGHPVSSQLAPQRRPSPPSTSRDRRWIKSDARSRSETDLEVVAKVFRLHDTLLGVTMALMGTPQAPDCSGAIEGDGVLDLKIGPFYTPASMAEVLDISLSETMRRLVAGEVLGAQLEDGAWVCPTWQLTNNQGRPEFLCLWRELITSADAWTALLWICATHPDLDSQSPRQWIENEQPAELTETLAAHTASRWAQ